MKEVAGTCDESDAAQVASSAANIIVPRAGDEAASQERGKRRRLNCLDASRVATAGNSQADGAHS